MLKPLLVLSTISAFALAAPLTEDHVVARAKLVDEINAMNPLWTASVDTRFNGLPIGASKTLCGVKPGSKALIDQKVASGEYARINSSSLLGSIQLPESFDSEANWPQCAKVIGDIRDQSNCGCCWAFGGAEAASDRLCIATNGSVAVPLSAQNLCFCASDSGCDGGFLSESWDYIKKHGLVTGQQQVNTKGVKTDPDPFAGGGFCSKFSLPHCHHHGPVGKDPYPAENAKGCPSVENSPACPQKCDDDAKAPHNDFKSDKYSFKGQVTTYEDADAIAAAIMQHGPVEAAFTVYTDFENYAGGIYHKTKGSVAGGHAIRIVGWGVQGGVKYWKVANSWNPYWGEKGYFRIKRGNNECGIEEQATSSSSSAKWSTPKGVF